MRDMRKAKEPFFDGETRPVYEMSLLEARKGPRPETDRRVYLTPCASDKTSRAVTVMLHLRGCYVSKAAILQVPVRRVLVENRSSV